MINSSSEIFYTKVVNINYYACLFAIIIGGFGNLITMILLAKADRLIRSKFSKRKPRCRPLTSAETYNFIIALCDLLFLVSHLIEKIIPHSSQMSMFQIINNSVTVCKLTLYIRNSTRLISSFLGMFLKMFWNNLQGFL